MFGIHQVVGLVSHRVGIYSALVNTSIPPASLSSGSSAFLSESAIVALFTLGTGGCAVVSC